MVEPQGRQPQNIQQVAELVGGPYDGCRVRVREPVPYVYVVGRYAYAITDDLYYECMGPDSVVKLNPATLKK